MSESRPTLPAGVKIAGWVSLSLAAAGTAIAAGLWIAGVRLDENVGSVVLVCVFLFGLPGACAIGLLRGYSWGRSGLLVCYVAATLLVVVAAMDWQDGWLDLHVFQSSSWGWIALRAGSVVLMILLDFWLLVSLLNWSARQAFREFHRWRTSGKECLPIWLQLLGWYTVVDGVVALFFVLLFATRAFPVSTMADSAGEKTLMGFVLSTLILMLPFGIGLLCRRDWGRKGLVIMWPILLLVMPTVVGIIGLTDPRFRQFNESISGHLLDFLLPLSAGAGSAALILWGLCRRKTRELFRRT